jgi:hypothetical protein
MRLSKLLSLRSYAVLISVLFTLLVSPLFGQSQGTLRGRVLDPQGSVVAGAVIVLIDSDGSTITTPSDNSGSFSISAEPGIYTLQARARGFSLFQSLVEITRGTTTSLDLELSLAVEDEEITVESEGASLQLSPEMNVGAMILSGEDLDALPDDPDELAEALEALAGPSAGPSGGQIYIDGFTGGRLPPKSSIREIRINQNPFSSEYRAHRIREDRDPDQARLRPVPRPVKFRFQRRCFEFTLSLRPYPGALSISQLRG